MPFFVQDLSDHNNYKHLSNVIYMFFVNFCKHGIANNALHH